MSNTTQWIEEVMLSDGSSVFLTGGHHVPESAFKQDVQRKYGASIIPMAVGREWWRIQGLGRVAAMGTMAGFAWEPCERTEPGAIAVSCLRIR